MSMVKQLAHGSVHKVSELWQQMKIFLFFIFLPVPVMCGRQPNSMNLFNMTVFKTKIKVKRAKLMFLPSSK